MGNAIAKFVGVLTRPRASMEALRTEESTSLKSAIVFILIMGVISGVISTIWGFIIPPPQVASGQVAKWSILLAVLLVPAISFILSFVGAFFLWALVFGLLKGNLSDYKTIYRIFALTAAFWPLNALLTPIPHTDPWLGLVINIWGIAVLIIGIIVVIGTPKIRTWISLGVIFIVLIFLGIAFRNEAQRQFAGGPGAAGIGGTDVNDLGDEEALNKELEDMANKAKASGQNPTAPAATPEATPAK